MNRGARLGSQPFLYYSLGNISGISSVLPTLLRGHRTVLVERFSAELWRGYPAPTPPRARELAACGLPDVGRPMIAGAQRTFRARRR